MFKRSLLLPLILALFFSAWGASQATAKPVPGIKQTQQYKVLLGFVNTLNTQKNVPATPTRKAKYRKSLSNKGDATNRQVKVLFALGTAKVKSRDDAEERRQVGNIRASQQQQVNALKAVLASKVADALSNYNAAVRRINALYAPSLNPLVRQRKILRRQLRKAKRPAKQEQIRQSIRNVQVKINRITDERQASTAVVTSRYQARVEGLNDIYSTRIQGVRSRAQQLVIQARRAWRQTYRADLNQLRERRTDQFAVVKRLRERGSGFITSMPPKG